MYTPSDGQRAEILSSEQTAPEARDFCIWHEVQTLFPVKCVGSIKKKIGEEDVFFCNRPCV